MRTCQSALVLSLVVLLCAFRCAGQPSQTTAPRDKAQTSVEQHLLMVAATGNATSQAVAGASKPSVPSKSETGKEPATGTQPAANDKIASTSKVKTPPCCKKPDVSIPPVPPAPKSTTAVYQRDLPRCVNAASFAKDFSSLFPEVKAIKQVGVERVLFFLDTTKGKDGKKPDLSGVEKEIDEVVKSLAENCPAIGVTYFLYPPMSETEEHCPSNQEVSESASKSRNEFGNSGKLLAQAGSTPGAISTQDGCIDSDEYSAWPVLTPATLDQWKAAIPGVVAILPTVNGQLLFVIKNTPDLGDPSRSRNMEDVKRQIKALVDREYAQVPEPFVVSLPPGINNGSTIAKALDGLVHNARITAGNDSRIVVTPVRGDSSGSRRDALRQEIQGLVNDLAVPTNSYSPDVTGQMTRLFYLRDNKATAAVLNDALPDVTAAPVGTDSIMLSAAIPGAEKGLRAPGYGDAEKNREALKAGRRLIAQMDQPHAQVSLFAWSLQLSRKEPNEAKARKKEQLSDKSLQLIHSIATQFNELVSQSVNSGWQFLREKVNFAGPSYFDPVFATYLRGRVVLTGEQSSFESGQLGLSTEVICCGQNTKLEYGLGFDKLFTDLSPNLMNMLLVVSASRNPYKTANCLINRMERNGPQGGTTSTDDCTWDAMAGDAESAWKASCQASDQAQYAAQEKLSQTPKGFQMECTRNLLRQLFAAEGGAGPNPDLGRFRAAVADFLFQYKLMIQYTNDFDPYLEPASAAKLDTQLVDFVDAFESDLAVLNFKLRDDVANSLNSLKPVNKSESYDYSGIVSVKVVAGNAAIVDSTAQNYFPATPPNTLASFANALSTAEQGQPKILTGNLSADAVTGALAGLAQVTPPKQTVSIGRELDMTVTPYTLSAATGAELDVEVTAKDNGVNVVGATPTGTNTTVDDLSSRVSNHYIKSHVRLQSLKLFELSSLDSTLARGKTPWKLIDPYLEIPAISELVRIPRHPDLIRQRSVVFLSAVVVPTAADLAATPLDVDAYRQPTSRTGKHLHSIAPELLEEVMDYHKRVLECISAAATDTEGNVTGCPAL